MEWLEKLKEYVEKLPIAILRLNDHEWSVLGETRRGVSEFTIALPHSLFVNLKAPTLCMILVNSEAQEDAYLGIIGRSIPITTIQSRIKVTRVVGIQPVTQDGLINLLATSNYKQNLRTKLAEDSEITLLSPKLSSHLIGRLAAIDVNTANISGLADSLFVPREFHSNQSLQVDAIRMALKAFGLNPTDPASSLMLPNGRDTALVTVPIIEDNVIEHDARTFPGYRLESSDLTGRAVFVREHEHLEVFTANRRKLEEAFGVDLIYFNVTKRSIVMVQYKMLERSSGEDWAFSPDNQLTKELERMRKFVVSNASSSQSYRFNPAVFYLKFVKRDGSIRNSGIILPIDHYDLLVKRGSIRGPKGGLRMSYNSLEGCYMREQPFLDLIKAGYIGAHAETTDALMTLVTGVLEQGRSVVAAIQTAVTESSTDTYN